MIVVHHPNALVGDRFNVSFLEQKLVPSLNPKASREAYNHSYIPL